MLGAAQSLTFNSIRAEPELTPKEQRKVEKKPLSTEGDVTGAIILSDSGDPYGRVIMCCGAFCVLAAILALFSVPLFIVRPPNIAPPPTPPCP